ncbi:hypothetical protein [Spirosoma oryzicola]|uniref:hypothetical protein n=1 Tax=Spirosoma oryzicola TaxID=2898794 RepID=UPI001E427223|nr:hypothetical protein [Spirosoma oryzicola]UHG94214.1 hypothetical protein LQ777_26965 [Spirosoma oryzicola]
MNHSQIVLLLMLIAWSGTTLAQTQQPGASYNNADFKLTSAKAVYQSDLDMVVMSMQVSGQAGRTTPKPVGGTQGAPVLAYVFPTTLKAQDVGFSPTEGIVALALTSHPDMDDTPLWDENNDGNFDNDGIVWHPHWVVLQEDKRVPGGLSVKAFRRDDKAVVLPKTAPGVPLYFDSPGYGVVTADQTIRVAIPAYRINHRSDFRFDAVTCYLQMHHPAHGEAGAHHETADKPMLGVYAVYGVLSGSLSLPYTVERN